MFLYKNKKRFSDSIICQLNLSRKLIRRRCFALDSGGKQCEHMIKKEFEILRNQLSNREHALISNLQKNKSQRINKLNTIDRDIKNALSICYETKSNVESIFMYDTKYNGAAWSILMSRKDRAVKEIEECIRIQIIECQTNYISSLIHTQMSMSNMLRFKAFGECRMDDESKLQVGIANIRDFHSLVSPSPTKAIDTVVGDGFSDVDDDGGIQSLQSIEHELLQFLFFTIL